jgi:hypothetical protein
MDRAEPTGPLVPRAARTGWSTAAALAGFTICGLLVCGLDHHLGTILLE